MQITRLTDEQESLRSVVRDVLARSSSMSAVREVIETDAGFDIDGWRTAGELGWLGLEVPEDLGGSGQTTLEAAIVLRELGRVASPGPYLSQFVAVGGLLHPRASDGGRRWLPQLASGEVIPAVALGRITADGALTTEIVVSATSEGCRLNGTCEFVLDGAGAGLLLGVARGDAGPIVFALDDLSGLRVERRAIHDRTRRLADLRFDDIALGHDGIVAEGDAAEAIVSLLWDRAALGVALDCVGGAAKVLEDTIAYTSSRVQYGRPIATFQAVKHTCADMFVEAETARVATDAAVLDHVGEPPSATYWSSNAKIRAGDGYARVAGDALQMHGGIGMTWEFDLHVWLKRAKCNQLLFGHSAQHRARLARLL